MYSCGDDTHAPGFWDPGFEYGLLSGQLKEQRCQTAGIIKRLGRALITTAISWASLKSADIRLTLKGHHEHVNPQRKSWHSKGSMTKLRPDRWTSPRDTSCKPTRFRLEKTIHVHKGLGRSHLWWGKTFQAGNSNIGLYWKRCCRSRRGTVFVN